MSKLRCNATSSAEPGRAFAYWSQPRRSAWGSTSQRSARSSTWSPPLRPRRSTRKSDAPGVIGSRRKRSCCSDIQPAVTNRILYPSLSHKEVMAAYRAITKEDPYGGGDFMRTLYLSGQAFQGMEAAVHETFPAN